MESIRTNISAQDKTLRERLNERIADKELARFEWLWELATDGLIEIRAWGVRLDDDAKPAVLTGRYNRVDELVKDIELLELCSKDIRVRLNPISFESEEEISGLDYARRPEARAEISLQRWLFVDIDSVRPADCSATEAERLAAWALTQRIECELNDMGWPEPVVADAGNGFQLLYPIELPTKHVGYVRRALKAIGQYFSSPDAKVNQNAVDAAQFIPLYGVRSGKGSPVCERPLRESAILKMPREVSRISEEEFEDLVITLIDRVWLRDS